MATDPVCGMKLDEKTAKGASVYGGRTWYFCSPRCRQEFETNPSKYAGGAQAPHEASAISKGKWMFYGFLAVAVFFLFTEHRAHVLGFLPYLLVLACPLMHLFMHHGHGHGHGPGHGHHGEETSQKDNQGDQK